MYAFRIYMVLHNSAFHVNWYFVLKTEKKLTLSNFFFFFNFSTSFFYEINFKQTQSFLFHIINQVDWQITWNGILSTVSVEIITAWTFRFFSKDSPSVTFLLDFQNPVSDTCFFKCLEMTEFPCLKVYFTTTYKENLLLLWKLHFWGNLLFC